MTALAWLPRRPRRMPRPRGLAAWSIVALVVAVLVATVVIVYLSQAVVEKGALSPVSPQADVRKQREIDKLSAEIRQIRSDTAGSLFWLKLLGVFVTVGTAVGGYLIGQSRTTNARLDFERRKNVDGLYQEVIQELSAESPLLRATAAAKLGKFLQSFPTEWELSEERRTELADLTEQVLAAALAIETEPKVLKALTIAIAMHSTETDFGDLRGVDLSGAKAADAFWKGINFEYADFYRADLREASLREATLTGAQFRETQLQGAVLAGATCVETNFKLTDLRSADLSGADLTKAKFEHAKVAGAQIAGATIGGNPPFHVDLSSEGDGSQLVPAADWLAANV
jgi:hypothetical protein